MLYCFTETQSINQSVDINLARRVPTFGELTSTLMHAPSLETYDSHTARNDNNLVRTDVQLKLIAML